jgi:hypothetical protein
MTGEGVVAGPGAFVIATAMRCDASVRGNDLLLIAGLGRVFLLRELTSVACVDDPAVDPGQRNASFDTMISSGTGLLNGAPATIEIRLTDAGEPGRNDTVTFSVRQGAATILSGSGRLTFGNLQAHNR